MAGHSEGGSGADVQLVVLQRVSAMAVVFTGGCDLDAGTQGQSCGPCALQVAPGLLVVVSRENLGVLVGKGRSAGLLQREHRLGRLVRPKVGIICREKGGNLIRREPPRRWIQKINVSYECSKSLQHRAALKIC